MTEEDFIHDLTSLVARASMFIHPIVLREFLNEAAVAQDGMIIKYQLDTAPWPPEAKSLLSD
jgi:hypothetical protein